MNYPEWKFPIKCPKCGSENIFGTISIYTTVNVQTGEMECGAIERYDGNQFEEFHCDDCEYAWA